MAGITGRMVGDELTKLWGFENCKDIKIHIPSNGLVEIQATFNGTEMQAGGLVDIIKRYRLEEIIEKEEKTSE